MYRTKLIVICLLLITFVSVSNAQTVPFNFLQAKWQPNGDLIALEQRDRVMILDSTLEEIITLTPVVLPSELTQVNILDVTWSPDGSKLAATVFSSQSEAQSTRLIIWDTATWEILVEVFNAVGEIVFSPNNQYVATRSGVGVAIFDLDTETVVNEIPVRSAPIVWNPQNNNEVAIGISTIGNIRIYNPFTGTILQELPYSYGFPPSYSPNGQYIALGRFDENGVRIVDVLDTINYGVVVSLPHVNGLFEETEAIYWLGNSEIGTSSFLGEAMRWNALTGERVILDVLDEFEQAYWHSDGSVFLAEGFDSGNNLEAIYMYDGISGEIVAQRLNTSESYIRAITLQDQNSGETVLSIINGTEVELATLNSGNTVIEAHSGNVGVGSVVFDLNGTPSFQIDDTAPYQLTNWTPTIGTFTLTATAYSESGGAGTQGIPYTVQFTVVDNSSVSCVSYIFHQTKHKFDGEISPVNSLLFWLSHAQNVPVFPVIAC